MGETSVGPSGIPIPPDVRSGPVVIGVDEASTCGRPLRGAVFLARALGRELLLVHVRRRTMPMVEGYVPIPEELGTDDAEDAVEADLVAALRTGGDLEGVEWQLVSAVGEAAAEIIRIAEEKDAACVVVGRKHKGFAEVLHRLASGSVSRAVVASQKFPVLVVP
jgi:nucleotide-binding universal stress UspA family protein